MSENKGVKFVKNCASVLFEKEYSVWFLVCFTLLVLFILLGARELWTQESRWANITQEMMIRKDYWHPFLNNYEYYDKPLLTYWIVIGFYKVFGFNLWAIRLPSVICGLITVWATYRIGTHLTSKKMGLIAGWLLITTFAYVYWARVASADIYNMAGIMVAVYWFLKRKDNPNFLSFFVFFLLLTATALSKGLVGPCAIIVALLPYLLYKNYWIKNFRWSCLISIIICVIIYLIPFLISHYTDKSVKYDQSGLYEVFRENVVRYFAPFDHEGPIYTYFLYLPVYTAPWIIFAVGGIIVGIWKWWKISFASKFYILALILLFIFFSGSGSRRSYYVLPLIPFTILLAADWIHIASEKCKPVYYFAGVLAWLSLIVVFILTILFSYGNMGGGIYEFSNQIKTDASKISPWNDWTVTYVTVKEEYIRDTCFYLDYNKLPIYYNFDAEKINDPAYMDKFVSELKLNSRNILMINKSYADSFEKYIDKSKYKEFEVEKLNSDRWFNKKISRKRDLVAFVPLN